MILVGVRRLKGYLNTQRFNLILDPKYYDDAVAIYEKYKQQESIYGVGIMNCKSEIKNIEVDPNSLFAKLEIENKYARFAAHMLLGKVIGVDTIEELKNHDISITDSGMLYKNRTALETLIQKSIKFLISERIQFQRENKYWKNN